MLLEEGQTIRKMRRRWREILLNALLVVLSTALAWALIEVSVWALFPEKRVKLLASIVNKDARGSLTERHFNNVYRYDSRFGWLPIANHTGRKWDRPVENLDNGVRSNGRPASLRDKPLILVVGDSYTFGDEVSDHETWPAHFERQTGIRTLNAAVSSFGLDQMILRAEALDDIYAPDMIVIAMIADSINRVGAQVRHGAHKPFFVAQADTLALRNVPAPLADSVEPLRYVLGHSYVLHFVAPLLAREYWWKGTFYDFRLAPNDPVDISCRLVKRIKDFTAQRGRKLVFAELVFEGDSTLDPVYAAFRPCLRAAAGPHVTIASIQDHFLRGAANRPDFLQTLRNPPPDSHLSPTGNAFVADGLIAQMQPWLDRAARP